MLPRPHAAVAPFESAWWKLDDAAGARIREVSGNDGTMAGAAVWVERGRGRALLLGEGGSHVKGRDRLGRLPAAAAPRSISAWFRTGTTNGDETNLFRYGDMRANAYFFPWKFQLFLRDTGRIGFGFGYRGGLVTGGPNLADDRWHFITATYDGLPGNTGRVFIDGAVFLEQKFETVPETPARAEWLIGGPGGYTGSRTVFRGAVDDVRVFSRALLSAQAMSIYRCSAGASDVVLPDGTAGYFLPVHAPEVLSPVLDLTAAGVVRHVQSDFAGIQFARSDGVCGLESLRGVDVGQNLRIAMDLLTPDTGADRVSAAGPYFRSRAAAPGDGIIGGESAGYWVQLNSTGSVKIRRLNPHEVVAFTAPLASFDASVFHRLEATARGAALEVRLDGRLLAFEQAGTVTSTVPIPAAWEGPPRSGNNQGTAGLLFAGWPRGETGGQIARNIQIERQ